ncbi:hypothetical protein MRX96_057152 [Rhipicephalus microplus]
MRYRHFPRQVNHSNWLSEPFVFSGAPSGSPSPLTSFLQPAATFVFRKVLRGEPSPPVVRRRRRNFRRRTALALIEAHACGLIETPWETRPLHPTGLSV